jgi:hypothetical protein
MHDHEVDIYVDCVYIYKFLSAWIGVNTTDVWNIVKNAFGNYLQEVSYRNRFFSCKYPNYETVTR